MGAAGEPVNFFGVIPFTLATYTGSVISIVLVIPAQSYVERFLEKVIPKAVKLVFVPMLTLIDQAYAVLFLASDMSRCINGEVLTVDCGCYL